MPFPDNSFFDNLKSSIDDLIGDEQLSIGRIGHPFTVPNGYFVALSIAINRRIDTLESPKSVIWLSPKLKIWYGAAASFLIASLVSFWFFTSPATTTVESLSSEDIIAYFEVEPISLNEISTAIEFSANDAAALTEDYLPEFTQEDDLYVYSAEDLMEEIQQINEK